MQKLDLTFETTLFDPKDPSEGTGQKIFLNKTYVTLTTNQKAINLQGLITTEPTRLDELDQQLAEIFEILNFDEAEHAARLFAVHAALDAIGFTFHRK